MNLNPEKLQYFVPYRESFSRGILFIQTIKIQTKSNKKSRIYTVAIVPEFASEFMYFYNYSNNQVIKIYLDPAWCFGDGTFGPHCTVN